MSEHGGDIYRNQITYDFSVNISPYGMPPQVRAALTKSMLCLAQYPDARYTSLKEAIADAEQVACANVLVGNGASELIYALMRALNQWKPACVVGLAKPCFSEYEKAARTTGLEHFVEYRLSSENDFSWETDKLDALLEASDAVILGNPNNPTGQKIPLDWIQQASVKAEHAGKLLILDESFLPLTSGYQVGRTVNSKAVIYIKSFTKSMAMPGIRLGYLLAGHDEIRGYTAKQLPEWNVSIPAMYAGETAAVCFDWLKQRVEHEALGLDAERGFLQGHLQNLGVKVFPSDTNFLLLRSESALYEGLLKEHFLIRKCDNFEGLEDGYYRIAVKSRKENELFLEAVKKVLEGDQTKGADCGTATEQGAAKTELLHVLPEDIEKTSFQILSAELQQKGIRLDEETQALVKRCIHTSADFEYAYSLMFSEGVMEHAKKLIRNGAHIVTDTNMALSGINKKELAKYGGEAHCYMADPEIARLAKERGTTRATMSMEYAAGLHQELIFVVGNAPTALVTLCDLMDQKKLKPGLIIGVPVGFVNVEAAKEMVMEQEVPYIVNRGRKGGSNIAAAIVNAILYEMRDEDNG